MKAVFYTITDNKNVIGKTLKNGVEKNINIKTHTEILNPNITIMSNTKPGFNYCFIEEFNRYYFIDNISVTPNNIYTMVLKVDVLETYKNDILNSNASIIQNKKYNPWVDSGYLYEVKKETDLYKNSNKIEYENNIILSTIGGV